MPRRRGSGVFGPKGTIHKSPARSAELLPMHFAVLQGRIMLGNAVGIVAVPIPLPSRSQMNRLFRCSHPGIQPNRSRIRAVAPSCCWSTAAALSQAASRRSG
jgi:hypothetical protein